MRAADAAQPGAHHRVHPRQTAGLAQRGQDDLLLEGLLEGVQHRALQRLPRADA